MEHNMYKETKNSALTTARAFHYQVMIGLIQCYNMKEGDLIHIEKDGDVSLITQDNQGTQIEAKNFSDSLTDHHPNFWKTLKNWLDPEFNHKQYCSLVLHTTQPFGAKSKLGQWNNLNTENRLELLNQIKDSKCRTNSNISIIERDVLALDESNLKAVISKIVLFTEQEDESKLKQILSSRIAMSGIPDGNISSYQDSLIGFIYNQGSKEKWSVSYDDFKAKLIDLTSQFSRSVFTFPEFTIRDASKAEITENSQKDFVNKITDIDYLDVIPRAIGDYLQLINSLNMELDRYPTYRDKTKKYQSQIIAKYESKYRTARRNQKNSQDLYDEVTEENPMPIENITPHLSYRNGLIHDAMNTKENLKWKVE